MRQLVGVQVPPLAIAPSIPPCTAVSAPTSRDSRLDLRLSSSGSKFIAMLSRPASGPIQIFAPDRGLVPGFSHRASRPSGTFAAEESSGGRPQGGGGFTRSPRRRAPAARGACFKTRPNYGQQFRGQRAGGRAPLNSRASPLKRAKSTLTC